MTQEVDQSRTYLDIDTPDRDTCAKNIKLLADQIGVELSDEEAGQLFSNAQAQKHGSEIISFDAHVGDGRGAIEDPDYRPEAPLRRVNIVAIYLESVNALLLFQGREIIGLLSPNGPRDDIAWIGNAPDGQHILPVPLTRARHLIPELVEKLFGLQETQQQRE